MFGLLGSLLGRVVLPMFGGAARPWLMAGAGSALGGLGSTQKQESTLTGSESREDKLTRDMMQAAVEPEYFTQFREEMIRRFLQEANNVPTQEMMRAQIMNQNNQLADDAIRATREALARTGMLRSGMAESALGNILTGKYSNIAQQMMQVPAMRQQMMLPFLQTGAQWTGAAPVSQHTFGTDASEMSRKFDQTQEGTMGTPWWRSALSGFGGALGLGFMRRIGW